MIHEEATKEAFGYYSSELSRGSHKLIISSCEGCGNFRIYDRHYYKTFCSTCIKKVGNGNEPYYLHFTRKYKQNIRNRFGNECFLCSATKAKKGRKCDVHHVDYDRSCNPDLEDCICVPLCHSCHMKTNGDRDFWQCLIMEMLKPPEAWE